MSKFPPSILCILLSWKDSACDWIPYFSSPTLHLHNSVTLLPSTLALDMMIGLKGDILSFISALPLNREIPYTPSVTLSTDEVAALQMIHMSRPTLSNYDYVDYSFNRQQPFENQQRLLGCAVPGVFVSHAPSSPKRNCRRTFALVTYTSYATAYLHF